MNPRKMTNGPLRKALLIIAIIAVSGCAHHGAAKITSTPTGAEVVNLDDGTVLGVTPVTVWWQESSSNRKYLSVRFKLDGYRDKVSSFWLSMRHGSQKSAMKDPQLVEVSLQSE
jgi:hypothetical protein